MTNSMFQPSNRLLFPAIIDSQNLLAAWEKVEENAGGPGVDGISVDVFGATVEEELVRLQRELREHTYRPQQLLRVTVAKPHGGVRALAIPTVRDRIAQTAAAQVITPILEAEFEDVSFGYRRGRSVEQALFKVRQYRDDGYQWVVDADLDSFFDNVDWNLLRVRLQQSISDPDILQLVDLWLRAEVREGSRFLTPTKGIAQGGPISPVLANLFLDRFDEEMIRRGYKLVRFADDFLILCKEKPHAEKALQLTESLLGELHLSLKLEKTRLTHFNQGFRYLGTLFLRTLDMPAAKTHIVQKAGPLSPLPSTGSAMALALNEALGKVGKRTADFPLTTVAQVSPLALALSTTPQPEPIQVFANPAPPTTQTITLESEAREPTSEEAEDEQSSNRTMRRVHIPFRRTLYVQEQGSVLARDDERLVVKKEGEVLLEVPAAKINQIFIFGNCTVTTPAMTYCLKEDIPIILFSSHGNYYGIIDSPLGDNVSLHRQQFARAADPSFRLATAITIVAGKLHNCRLLLQRHQRRKQIPAVAAAIDQIGQIAVRLAKAETVEETSGYEGAAAAQYFSALGQLVHPSFRFAHRTRQPPTDPVNSLLSFGYTLLFYNLYALIAARGLHPYVGHLHALRDRHPALASDLIEEFRAPIVDSLVLYVVNSKVLTPADFSQLANGPCLLKDKARQTFIRAFEQKMATQITHAQTGLVVDYRRCLDLQVCHMADWIRGEVNVYQPMRMR